MSTLTAPQTTAVGHDEDDDLLMPPLVDPTLEDKAIREKVFGALFDSDDEGVEDETWDLDAQLAAMLNESAATTGVTLDEFDDRIMEFQEDPIVKDALAKGVDLKDYSKHIEKELNDVEKSSVQDYINQRSELDKLHSQIQVCDNILATMENLLGGFQKDLAGISEEIQSLQDQSVSMNIRLKNRKAAEESMSSFLEQAVIPPELIKKICDGEINETFTQELAILRKKIEFVEQYRGRIPLADDIAPEVEKLRLKAADRVRDFLYDKIKQLNRKKTNVAIHQQTLRKYKHLNKYLMDHHPQSAHEIRATYVHIMEDYFHKNFSTYTSSLFRLLQVVADRQDLVGYSDRAKRGLFSSQKQVPKDRSTVYTLENRMEVLNQIDADVIVPHVAEEKMIKFSFEQIFRSMNRMLMDNASSEYVFICEFFNVKGDAALVYFDQVMENTINLAMGLTRKFIEETYDAIGLLICVRINTKHQYIMQHRRIPCLDRYQNKLAIDIWPRFQQIMDRHINSLHECEPDAFGPLDVHPHLVVRRYAELASSIAALNDGFDTPTVLQGLKRLATQCEVFINRYAEKLPQRQRLEFYINQCDLCVTVFGEVALPSVDIEKEMWVKMLADNNLAYADQELTPFFGSMIVFVKKTDITSDLKQIPAEQFEQISIDFTTNWKAALSKINQNVMTSFANFKTGTMILQSIIKQMVLYYTQFMQLVEKRFGRNAKLPFREEPVSVEKVKVEVKNNFKATF